MGYHISILRTDSGSQQEIEISEVHTAVSSDWIFESEQKCFEKVGSNNETCTLWYFNGELWTKNPSQWAIEQMIELASKLNARVRGDEFETYTSDKTYLHPDDAEAIEKANKSGEDLIRESVRVQKIIRVVFIGFFVVVSVVAFIIGKSFE